MPDLVIHSFDPEANFNELTKEVENTNKTMASCIDLCCGYLFHACDKMNATSMDLTWSNDQNETVARCYIFSGKSLKRLEKLIEVYKTFIHLETTVLQFLAKVTGKDKLYQIKINRSKE